ncbi:hypothetical protein FD13_GL001264 [Levilactobacillus senmaizukei DSM 21775 = NBRC 103853]|uniref:DUF2922 domain-containing protein n=2 Tax=Levilactobacillus TaxID=2767886 RepID=A0A0R2DSJ4_9LACO|nr:MULTISPECIES: DUF2922 domain-containing protein [Levilactobacillus]KRN02948.1 hypothetical protein FD13_GL001264 [Levilactobacillus senmaizukei DSM 21775 = NBRC 103853]
MKALELTFKGSDTRIKHLRLKYVNTDLQPKEIQHFMETLAATKLFAKEGVDLYAEPVKADLVDTNTTTLVPVV